jgi:hypothetical protein
LLIADLKADGPIQEKIRDTPRFLIINMGSVPDFLIQGWAMDAERLKHGGSVLGNEFFVTDRAAPPELFGLSPNTRNFCTDIK